MKHLLIEEAHPIITDYLADFCAFACEKLGLATCPPITFVEHTGNASFGSYSPSEGTVVVATSGRHAADILRTLAHEFVHEQQIKQGTEQSLVEMEYDANAIAGMIMRDYNQLHPGLYGVMDSVGVENDTDEHESFGQGVPTNPPYPTTMAEASLRWPGSRKPLEYVYAPRREHVPNYAEKVRMGVIKQKTRHLIYPPTKFGMTDAEKAGKKIPHAIMEDGAPVNAAGSGEIAGIGVGPQGEPGIKKSQMIRRKPKSGLATIFAGLPRKTLKEYKATITRKLNWDDIEKDKIEQRDVEYRSKIVTDRKKKNLGFLGLPHSSLSQILRGKKP